MTTKLQTYPKYKPSGIDWLGDIPSEWQILKFKELFRTSNERVKDDPSVDTLLSVSGYRGVEPKDISSMEGQMPSEDISEYRIVRKGQLAVNTMWLNYAGLGVSEYEGYISPAYRAYYIKSDIDNRFAHYLLRSLLYVQKFTSLLYGVRPNSLQVKPYDFEHIEILLPPLKTQKRIADFLDEKTKIIDELIEKKEKLIELLREKRAALITRAVTKGLNPNAKLKPSDIDWLGDIPVGWKIERLKRISKIDTTGVWGDEPESCENPVQVVSTPYVSSEGKISGDLPLRCVSSKELKYYSCREGDLLVVKSSGSATNVVTGKAGLVTKEYEGVCFSNFLLRIRPRTILAKYLHYFLNSYSVKDRIRMMVSTTTYPNLKLYEYRGFEITIPSNGEQKRITDFLGAETTKVDKAVALIESQIEKLKEYRSSLIYHAVTGKIKV